MVLLTADCSERLKIDDVPDAHRQEENGIVWHTYRSSCHFYSLFSIPTLTEIILRSR